MSDHFIGDPFSSLDQAMAACTHLGVGAHPDDLEVMAGHGILECLESETKNFFGVICTNGGGSTRSGSFQNLSDADMAKVRKLEQFESARLGEYGGVQLLGFDSADIKSGWNQGLIGIFSDILIKTQPQVIYTHNLFDKHQTHVAVVAHLIEALRQVNYSPQAFYGCEVWRGLDWLPDEDKQALPVEDSLKIKKLIACHKSQTESGKDYATATLGRMASNATFFEANREDQVRFQIFALDLQPFLQNPGLNFLDFASQKIERLQQQVKMSLTPFSRSE